MYIANSNLFYGYMLTLKGQAAQLQLTSAARGPRVLYVCSSKLPREGGVLSCWAVFECRQALFHPKLGMIVTGMVAGLAHAASRKLASKNCLHHVHRSHAWMAETILCCRNSKKSARIWRCRDVGVS